MAAVDEKWSSHMASLLRPPSPVQVQDYFHRLVLDRNCSRIKVIQHADFGKGVYADDDFEEGELVLKDPILVGMQHSSNKFDCLVCSFCFRFIGSIELQIGRKLYFQSIGVSPIVGGGCYDAGLSHMEEHSHLKIHEKLEDCVASSSSSKDNVLLPKEVVDALMNGEFILPHSAEFPLPSPVSCPGGCKEAYYCSKLCAEADWSLSHSLLCTGERSESLSREALLKFIQHANGSNDIFLLAAKPFI